MQVNQNIHLLKGAKRYALYNLNDGYVISVSDIQVEILKTISSGLSIRTIANYPFPTLQSELLNLIAKKIVVAGRRKVETISFPNFKKPVKPNIFKHVWLELTNSCNLTCNHCYAGSSPKVKIDKDLNTFQWKIILNKLFNKGIKKITFIGGEPLIQLDTLNSIIEYIHTRSPKVNIIIYSNLTIMQNDKDWFAFLKDHNVTFGTSLYGIEAETHDRFTKKNNSWDLTINNIKTLLENNFKVFVGYFHNQNESLFEENKVRTFLRNLGIQQYKINTPIKAGRASNKNHKTEKLLNRLPVIKYFSLDSFVEDQFYHNCYKDVLTIKSDGTVLPCIMSRSFPICNLLTDDIDVLNKSELHEKFVSLSKDKISGCKECEFRYGCFDCRPDASEETKNIYMKSDCGYDPNVELGNEMSILKSATN